VCFKYGISSKNCQLLPVKYSQYSLLKTASVMFCKRVTALINIYELISMTTVDVEVTLGRTRALLLSVPYRYSRQHSPCIVKLTLLSVEVVLAVFNWIASRITCNSCIFVACRKALQAQFHGFCCHSLFISLLRLRVRTVL